MITQIPIALPSVGEEEWLATRDAFESGWLTQGPKVREFEDRFAAKHNVARAIAVSSCTTGLHLALVAHGVGPGDEVIVPAFTWVSTANVVVYCGAKPVFVDVDPATFNIDLDKVAAAVTDRTKAIIPVHLFGCCVDVEVLRKILPTTVVVIEDAACAAGATLRGKPAGSLGDCGVFSFHPRKTITTGEGGMLTTNDYALADLVDKLRNHGAAISEEQRHHGPKPYLLPSFEHLGFNYRMTDLQGAVGAVQLTKLDGFIEERQQLADAYDKALQKFDWLTGPKRSSDSLHSQQAYVCRIDPDRAPIVRNKLMERLQERGVSTRPGTHAVVNLDYYINCHGVDPRDYPGALAAEADSIALPLHNKMTIQDVGCVVQAIDESVRG